MGGGGIYCDDSSPAISNNTINGNSACSTYGHGGGISCGSSCPTISNNTISGNSAYKGGGGIYCSVSSPTISNNTISGNSGYKGGGGIFCYYSSPTISNNTISGNSAYKGGGIYCDYNCNPAICNNAIGGNSANDYGGGIYCYWSSPTISNNTISRNSARNNGGGIYCYASFPDVMNTILWLDSAPNGPEIYLTGSSSPEVTYSDVQGGWSGTGNINCDPEFVNPDSGNFHLQMTSCCIDSGDPDPQYNDPDGTRNDIGAFYFRQEPPATVQLMPHENVIILPPEGGSFSYDAWIYNLTGSAITVDVWAYAFVPGIGRYGPIRRYNNVRVRRWNDLGRNNLSQQVPSLAPAGEYSYVAYIGEFDTEIIDSSYFTFTKLGTPGGKDLGWLARGDWFEVDDFAFQRETVLPTDFALSQNYPNPFNAKTTFNYQLPVSNDVKLEVYNLLGQKLATLVDERQEAGYKSVIWDASEVSSGLYFYKLTAGEYTETRRMMLVK
jgi:parallel beta-helix repeat protein/predicted outer membrane repeat protein